MGQATQEEYRYIFQVCRDEFRKAKPQLGLKVVRNVTGKVMVRRHGAAPVQPEGDEPGVYVCMCV